MRRTTIAAGLAAAAIAGTALAVPALADTSTPTATTSTSQAAASTTLTPAQQQELDDFLAAHPRVAKALVARIERWKQFADAHPALVAELKTVAQLPPDQRRAALQAWLKDHPDDAKAWHEFRQQVRADRKERRDQRRERRQQRQNPPSSTPSAPTPSSPTTGSSTGSTAG